MLGHLRSAGTPPRRTAHPAPSRGRYFSAQPAAAPGTRRWFSSDLVITPLLSIRNHRRSGASPSSFADHSSNTARPERGHAVVTPRRSADRAAQDLGFFSSPAALRLRNTGYRRALLAAFQRAASALCSRAASRSGSRTAAPSVCASTASSTSATVPELSSFWNFFRCVSQCPRRDLAELRFYSLESTIVFT